jgi:hypothetical protein
MQACFGSPELVVKVPADLTELKAAVEKYLQGRVPRDNGDVQGGDGFRKVVVEYWNVVKGMVGGISHCQSFPSIRVKEKPSHGPYDTYKLHSDVFAGDPSGVVVMIPLFGDIENGGVEFYKPTRGRREDFCFYSRYDLAPDFKPEYLGKMEPDKVHFVDAFCLHKTMVGKKRVSLDHRLIFDRFLESDSKGTRMRNYVPLEEFP